MVKDSITQGLSDLGINISGFFSDLGENIGTWFSDTLEDISEFKSSVGIWFSSLGTDLGNWFSDTIKDISEFNSSVGTWFSSLGTDLGNWFINLVDNLTNLLSYINPFDENFLGKKLVDLIGDLLTKLFVPQQDHFTQLDTNLKSKLGFIEQIKELVFDLFNLNDEEGYEGTPNWSIKYQGVEVDIIDWTAFEKFRGILHSIIIFIVWASFLIRLFKRIPKIIYGYDDK